MIVECHEERHGRAGVEEDGSERLERAHEYVCEELADDAGRVRGLARDVDEPERAHEEHDGAERVHECDLWTAALHEGHAEDGEEDGHEDIAYSEEIEDELLRVGSDYASGAESCDGEEDCEHDENDPDHGVACLVFELARILLWGTLS